MEIPLIDIEKIKKHLMPSVIEKNLHFDFFENLDSTNQYLLENSYRLPHRSVCIAESQFLGRGTRQRVWVSPKHAGIYFSLLWKFQKDIRHLQGLSLAIGILIVESLNALKITSCEIKWPNDIYHHKKKLAGILIELQTHSDNDCSAVIGIGINYCFPEDIKNSIEKPITDMFEITETPICCSHLLAILINHLIHGLEQFSETGFSSFLERFQRYDFLYGKNMVLRVGKNKISGKACGIDMLGRLLVRDQAAMIHAFASAEIEIKEFL